MPRGLTDVQKKAISMRVQGKKLEAIATECGVTAMTIHNWVEGTHADKVAAITKKVNENMVLSFAQRMNEDAQTVWGDLMKIAQDTTAPKHVRVVAIDSILDRAGAPRTSKNDSRMEVRGLSEDQRKENYERILHLITPPEPEPIKGKDGVG